MLDKLLFVPNIYALHIIYRILSSKNRPILYKLIEKFALGRLQGLKISALCIS